MRFRLIALASLAPSLLLADGAVRGAHRAALAPLVERETEARLAEWVVYYKELHTSPELSLHETESARKLAARLRELGYDVTTGIGGNGLAGVLRNGAGPTVLIRGDMDALPVVEETGLPYASTVKAAGPDGVEVGVMHACGHDVHQTTLIGTATVLAQLKDRWRGTVVALGQPAEEIGKGARMMIADGLFERVPRPDYCVALHVASDAPAGVIAYAPGWALANVDSVDITIHGRGGHGSRPNETIDPVVAAAQVVLALQTIVSRRVDPREPAVVTVGSIHSGSKHNIISNEARLQLTVRSYGDETRRLLLDGIREITTHTCRAMGCERDPDIRAREDEFTPATYNDPQLAALAADVLRQVVGEQNVLERQPVMGGEDFGRYSKHLEVPGFMFFLGSVGADRFQASQQPGAAPLPSLHSSQFYPDPGPTISTGVRCLSSIALALLDEG